MRGGVPVALLDPIGGVGKAVEGVSAFKVVHVLAGVFEAVRSGLGVALMATVVAVPDGLTERDDLPAVRPAAMSLRARTGADPSVAEAVAAGLRPVLAAA